MSGKITNKEPYQQAYYPPAPTGFTRYMRTSLIWQAIRFLVNGEIASLSATQMTKLKQASQANL
jgi:hypothetical protein